MSEDDRTEQAVREAAASVLGDGADLRHLLACSYCAWQVQEKANELLAQVSGRDA